MGSSLRSGRNCGWGEWMSSVLSTFNTTTEVRPLSKAPNPQLLPRRPLLRVCVHGVYVFTTVCVHLDGLNAEHKFWVWVTILGHTSLLSFIYISIYSCIHPSFYISIHLFLHACIHPSFYRSIHLSIAACIHPSIDQSIRPFSILSFIHSYILLSTSESIHPSKTFGQCFDNISVFLHRIFLLK